MKVFSKWKYIQERGKENYIEHKSWVDFCDGEPVVDGWCRGCFHIPDEYCIDVTEQQKEGKRMWTMKDFITKPIAVRVGQKHVQEFLRMCEDEGLRWSNGNKPTEFVPDLFGDDLSITANSKNAKGKLLCSPAEYYRDDPHMELFDFDDFAGRPIKYRIVIESDGKNTTAVMEVNGEKVREAEARLHPADKFNWNTGAELAFGRLWNEKDKQPKVREVKRKAKVGEYVKITDAWLAYGYKNGDVLKVTDFDSDGCALAKGTNTIYEREYVVLEGYTPGLRVGDRVVYVGCSGAHGGYARLGNYERLIGKHGRVIGIEHTYVCVEFDEEIIGGHSCLNRGKDGHCWYCWPELLLHE